MITIINEIDGVKYELVPSCGCCGGCAFNSSFGCILTKDCKDFNYRQVCKTLLGIWKKVSDAD
jgi:hypothetical protein